MVTRLIPEIIKLGVDVEELLFHPRDWIEDEITCFWQRTSEHSSWTTLSMPHAWTVHVDLCSLSDVCSRIIYTRDFVPDACVRTILLSWSHHQYSLRIFPSSGGARPKTSESSKSKPKGIVASCGFFICVVSRSEIRTFHFDRFSKRWCLRTRSASGKRLALWTSSY